VDTPHFLQNKPNFKMGNINISTAQTKAYANEQRTMNNERHPKQTQSNPISKSPRPERRGAFECHRAKQSQFAETQNELNRL
jgi:hypothetical protein